MTVTTERVDRYIESGRPFAESKIERLILQRAEEMNTPQRYRRRRNPHEPATSKEGIAVEPLEESIWNEIHEALCKKTGRYRKNVETAGTMSTFSSGMISLYLAGKLGIAVAVIAGLVAAKPTDATLVCKRNVVSIAKQGER